MSWLSRDIRQAYLSSIAWDENNDIVTFNTPGANSVKYSLVAGQLKREYPTATVIIIANDITGLLLPAIEGNIQKVTLEASKTFFSGGQERTITFSLTEQVTVRNP